MSRRIELTKKVLASKSSEYSTSDDKLHNFKNSPRGFHPSEVLQGYMDKHLVSYFDILEGIKNGKKYTREYLDEKIGDIINYFILQEAVIVEILECKEKAPEQIIGQVQIRYNNYLKQRNKLVDGKPNYLFDYPSFGFKEFESKLQECLITDNYLKYSWKGYIFGELPIDDNYQIRFEYYIKKYREKSEAEKGNFFLSWPFDIHEFYAVYNSKDARLFKNHS